MHKQTSESVEILRDCNIYLWWRRNGLTSLWQLIYRSLNARLIGRHRRLNVRLGAHVHFIDGRICIHWKRKKRYVGYVKVEQNILLWLNWLTGAPDIEDGGWVSCAIRALPWVVDTGWFCGCKYGLGCCAGGGIVQWGDPRLTCPWKNVLSKTIRFKCINYSH